MLSIITHAVLASWREAYVYIFKSWETDLLQIFSTSSQLCKVWSVISAFGSPINVTWNEVTQAYWCPTTSNISDLKQSPQCSQMPLLYEHQQRLVRKISTQVHLLATQKNGQSTCSIYLSEQCPWRKLVPCALTSSLSAKSHDCNSCTTVLNDFSLRLWQLMFMILKPYSPVHSIWRISRKYTQA
jgi:hypothetical protein